MDIATDAYLKLLVGSTLRGGAPAAETARPSTGAIMFYIPALRVGGGELSLLRLAEGLADRGESVIMVVNDSSQGKLVVSHKIELVSLGTTRSLGAVRQLARLLRQRRPGTLLTAFPHSNLVAVTARCLARVRTKVVISEHAPLSRQVAHMGGWRYRFLPHLARLAYPRAAAVVAVSSGVADDLRGLVPGLQPRLIHNPVLATFWEESASQPVEHPWLLDDAIEVVLTASRLSTEKDIPTLLRAFHAVAQARPAARLIIAGDGPVREELERLVVELGLAEKVLLAGSVLNILSWMRHAEVFVLASRFEGFGNVLVEALAAGAQVVSTDCPVGPREVLRGGDLGDLVPVADARAMSSAIIAALQRAEQDPQAVRAKAQAHSKAVSLVYTQEQACASYLALLRSLHGRGPMPTAVGAGTLQN